MWKISLMSGREFVLSEKEARAVIKAMEIKAPVNLSFGVINGSSVESIIDEDAAVVRSNRIINDEDFKKFCNGNSGAIDSLNRRYPGDKFTKEWEEALKFKEQTQLSQLSQGANS